ncbi:MAG: hypothetical protein Q4C12_09065, partial [Clostridia bacterium]|nr:hypothetical protein [Clostridia bacterium]
MGKRITAILLAAMMVFVLLPKTAFAWVNGAWFVEYDVWVGGIRITSDNCGNVRGDGSVVYHPTSNRLDLHNANISSNQYGNASYDPIANGIYTLVPLTIMLDGNNTITGTNNDYGRGIYAYNHKIARNYDITIGGGGNLTISGTHNAIKCGTLTFAENCGKVTATGVRAHGLFGVNVNIKGGVISATSQADGYGGICAGNNIIISRGTVIASNTNGYAFDTTAHGGISFEGNYADDNCKVSVGTDATHTTDLSPSAISTVRHNYKYCKIEPKPF